MVLLNYLYRYYTIFAQQLPMCCTLAVGHINSATLQPERLTLAFPGTAALLEYLLCKVLGAKKEGWGRWQM